MIESEMCRLPTYLAVHLYDEDSLRRLLIKIRPLLHTASEIWFSSSNKGLLEQASKSRLCADKHVRTFEVDNRWHDWSGYLAFLGACKSTDRLIICNDSILTRRFVSNYTLHRFLLSIDVSRPAIIGELDTAQNSVDLKCWSSACWISTYLFAIQGFPVDVKQLEVEVESCINHMESNPNHFFNRYLTRRRSNIVAGNHSVRSKLGAMFFERYLTRFAIERGASIINYCAGSRVRKIERLLERLRDE